MEGKGSRRKPKGIEQRAQGEGLKAKVKDIKDA